MVFVMMRQTGPRVELAIVILFKKIRERKLHTKAHTEVLQ